MGFTVLRQSERIWNKKMEAHNSMPRQTKREGAGARVPASARRKSKKNIQRHKRHTSLFNKLPDVLVMEILSRLPPKSFFRCKSVCKTWLSLSSDAVRLNKHLQPTLSGFFYNQGCGATCFVNFLSCGINKVEVDGTMSALSCDDNLRILDCCNGLLIVGSFKKESQFAHDIHVYNPATRTLFTLWYPKQQNNEIWYQVFSLAFDPQVFHQFHVIRFTGKYGAKVNFIDIFSYERGKCKHHKKLLSDGIINLYSKGIFVDGRVHRLTTQNEILCIDPNNCTYQVIRPPNLENRAMIEIGQSRGVLHCMSVFRDGRVFIWVLESYTRQEWTLKYQLSLDAMYQGPLPYLYRRCINRIKYQGHFAFHPEKDVLFMPAEKNDFMSLDLSTGKGDKLDSLGNNRFDLCVGCWVYMPCYLE
ncbi:F-box protein [Carex littledalei]|uniref:F-box protein n=1 Tax=Carex littledalei TaxID=544730 RepID=A0A833QHQ2_9POAL|nr:F-box protein [Carex littledalei]